ncbi:MAG: thiolase C-terminal domain-containing protein, partial [Dehalococcoidia bacterium]
MSEHTIKDKVAIVGIGETAYYKRGAAPESEFQLTLKAILKAAEDAGLPVTEIDGFASYSMDRNDPPRLQSALGIPDLTFSNMFWGGGGGGGSGAVANASAALVAGYAKYVVVYRGLAQGQFGRFGQSRASGPVPYPMSYTAPYGLMSPAQMFAMRVRRFMHDHHVSQAPLKAISLTSYHHAQSNPRAVMYGRQLSAEDYDNSRWIV